MKYFRVIKHKIGEWRNSAIFLCIFIKNNFIFREIKTSFKKNNLTNVRFITSAYKWYGKTSFCFYVVAKLQGAKCFIKVGNESQVKNEYYISKYMNDNNIFLLHSFKAIKTIKFSHTYGLVFPYYSYHKINKEIPLSYFRRICAQLEEAILSLNNADICHCDININNILIIDDLLVLSDYGASFYDGQKKDYLYYIRNHWINRIQLGNKLLFDNFADAVKALEAANFPKKYYECNEYMSLKNHIGEKIFQVVI